MTEATRDNSGFAIQEALFDEDEVSEHPPISGIVLKATARCDYACRHCYVFEAADQTWQLLPRKLEPRTIATIGERIAEYVEMHDLPQMQVVLHGGEPFLFGRQHTQQIVEGIRSQVRDTTYLAFSAHSNAHLLGKDTGQARELIDYLQENRIAVSTSLDGDRRSNDYYRRYRDGSSTYDDTIAGINVLREKKLLRGILAVMVLGDIDFEKPPEAVVDELRERGLANYQALLEHNPSKIDFLFPLAHRGNLPPGMMTAAQRKLVPYATWLKPVFDAWYDTMQHKYFDPASDPAQRYAPDVRIFSSIINRLEGRASSLEALGSLGVVDSVMIDADGKYGVVDTLAATDEGEYRLAISAQTHSIDQAVAAVQQNARLKGISALPQACQACPVRNVCQGGYAPHRYDPGASSDEMMYGQKTIYSSNLLDLISHINGQHITAKVRFAGQRSQQAYYGEGYNAVSF